MRNYQPKKDGGYKLDSILYRRMLYLVKDYARMKREVNNIINSSPNPELPAAEGRNANPTLNKVVMTEKLSEECRAVEWALEQIPEEYREIIFNKICCDAAYPLFADPSTFSRWRCRFLYQIAKKLMYI